MNVIRARPASRSSKDTDFNVPTKMNEIESSKYCIRRVKSDPKDLSWSKSGMDDPLGNNHEDNESTTGSSSRDGLQIGRSVFAAVEEFNMTQSFSRFIAPRSSDSTNQEFQIEGMPEFTTGGRFKEPQFQTKATSKFSNFFRRRRSVTSKVDSSVISANDIYMQGYLSKQGSWRKNWKTRYFILRIDEPGLVYCDSDENREVLGIVPITKDTTVIDLSSTISTLAFEVINPQRKLLLEAPSAADLKRWIDAIQETIELVSSRAQEDEEVINQPRTSPEVRVSVSRDDLLSVRSSTTHSVSNDDLINLYDVRIELQIDGGKDRMAYYVLLEGLERDHELQHLAQTDIFRCPETNQSFFRYPFTFLLPLHPEKFTDLRFSVFRAPLADDVHFGKTPFAVGAVEMATFLPNALSQNGFDLHMQLPKKERSTTARGNATPSQASRNSLRSVADESECGITLHITAFTPDKRIVVGLPDTTVVTSQRKYIMPTSLNSCGIVVVESLSVPKATFSMPIAYLQFLIDDLDMRVAQLKQTVHPQKLGPILEHYSSMQKEARSHIDFLEEEAKGKAHFKRSTYKKKREWSMVATNLHMQTMQVYGGQDISASYTTITMGAAAVHTRGFSNGGATRMRDTLLEVLQEANRLRKQKSKDQDPLINFELYHTPIGLLSSSTMANGGNKSYDPVAVARKSWFELEARMQYLCVQVLSATAAHICSLLELAAKGSVYHTMIWELVMRNNMLLNFESLLSTQGNEGGMLEDFHMACKWLEQVSFSFDVSPNPAEPVGYRISREQNLLKIVVRIPITLGECLPKDLATGKRAFRVLAVLFTQGVNEMQSLAHAMHSSNTQIQDRINRDSCGRLQSYFNHFKKKKCDQLQQPTEGYGQPFQPVMAELEKLWSQIETNILQQPTLHKKNIRLLMTTSEFCRQLGGARATCCKSGKDRTAMSVTLEQARLLVQESKALNLKQMIETMRLCGVRRDNVFKNIQSQTYAFNELQRKLLPECYKPPFGTYKKGST